MGGEYMKDAIAIEPEIFVQESIKVPSKATFKKSANFQSFLPWKNRKKELSNFEAENGP